MDQSRFNDFLEEISILRVCEYDASFPEFLEKKLTRDDKIDFAVDLALLPEFYGNEYENIAYAVMEAYLWSNIGKRALQEFGWREGNIVLVDFSNKAKPILSVPQADVPMKTLCTPYVWKVESTNRETPRKLFNERFSMDSEVLKRKVNSSINFRGQDPLLAVLWKDEHLKPRFTELLCDLMIDPSSRNFFESTELSDLLINPVFERAKSIFRKIDSGNEPTKEELESALGQSLSDRLLHILVAEHIASFRRVLSSDDHVNDWVANGEARGDEFVEYFNNVDQILFVDDAEISLVCLEYCIGEKHPTIAAKEVEATPDSHDFYYYLGLATKAGLTPRGHNLLSWIKRFVGIEETSKQNLDEMKSRWKETPLDNSEVVLKVRQLLSEIVSDSYSTLRAIVKLLYRKTRSRRDIENQHRIRIDIHNFLRYVEPTPRHLLAFPMTLTGKKTVDAGKTTAYFLGTIGDQLLEGARMNQDQQIIFVKRFVEQVFTNATIKHHLEEELKKKKKEADWNQVMGEASFVFGHETKNRADAMQPSVHKRRLRELLGNPNLSENDKCALNQMGESFSLVEELYGISELISQLKKITAGKLPMKWVQPSLKDKLEGWPSFFAEHSNEFIQRWIEGSREFIKYSLSPYAHMVSRTGETLLLREIVDNRLVNTSVMDVFGASPKIYLPPFHRFDENRAPTMAILSCVGEHLRNAARYLVDSTQASLQKRVIGFLHIDYSINLEVNKETNVPSIRISIWNPCVDENYTPSQTIEIMSRLYGFMNNAISIAKCERREYLLGGENKGDYLLSEVIITPSKFQFV